jgi:hypothetical protein
MSNLFMDILSILKKYPPAKNENKFIYGKLAESRIIYWINKIVPCLDLDKMKHYGSEYKNDCIISTDTDTSIKYSIKVSKSGGSPTLINKRNKSEHNVNGCYFIICHIDNRKLYIFKHSEELDPFIRENHESIQYKSNIFKHLDRNNENYYTFQPSEELLAFETDVLPTIEEMKIYDILSDKLNDENSIYYN